MSILTRKYPFTSSSHWLRDSAVYCTVVFLIMYLLQPFGFSMYPLLVGGRDSLILNKIDRKLKRGDICLYRRDTGIYVTHSVHHVDKAGIYLLGESQTGIEGPLSMDHMLAYAEGFVRKGKLYSCSNLLYRFFHEIWIILRPARPMFIKAYRKVMRY